MSSLAGYIGRHIGPSIKDVGRMLNCVGFDSVDSFVRHTMPKDVLVNRKLEVGAALSESELTARLREIAAKNVLKKSLIGRGYYGTILPAPIQRNLLEDPGWYTSYTPYQPEISQGRLESLLNFQTMIISLTGMDIANASLLDEATSAAEAMMMSVGLAKGKKRYLVDSDVLPQTLDVLKSRGEGSGVVLEITNLRDLKSIPDDCCGVLASYPGASGELHNWEPVASLAKEKKALFTVTSDLLALSVIEPPVYADVVVGSAQRFGVPVGFGGPHAGFFATKEAYKRKMPGRIVGVSKGRRGERALRLALQTREQHIRRDKATSNICTAQALLANISAMYAVYHGPDGIKAIANRVNSMCLKLAQSIPSENILNKTFFDTVTIKVNDAQAVKQRALEAGFNIWVSDNNTVAVSLDESTTNEQLETLCALFKDIFSSPATSSTSVVGIPNKRTSEILTETVFNRYHSETELMRYMTSLRAKDLSLTEAMIPLGSCTMKLNSATAMAAISWPEFTEIHPFVPSNQAAGYYELIAELEKDLSDITGFAATSLQPNSGAQGEFTGLKTIRSYLNAKGEGNRNVCLVPVSAHGTNPASAAVAGMKIVAVKCQPNGELDIADLQAKAEKNKEHLAAFMVTYPSTYGVYEPGIRKAIDIVHANGGQVYMDGANMNAQVGLTSPGDLGADVCHLNLHKTFCIPHGGGGPGVGPICVKDHLVPYLPGHSVVSIGDKKESAVSAAPFGSALILPIPWAYIKMMGSDGLRRSSEIAMLNANYMMKKLETHYKILFTNSNGLCAHEFIIDLRSFKSIGVEAIDVAKRLQDYGFHAPTMSWPVPNTLMIEPTESESLYELDRFVEAMISIRKEIEEVESGKVQYKDSVLAHAPHSAEDLILDDHWNREYPRKIAAYPVPALLRNKFWPSVTRVDDTYGDLHLVCSCGTVEDYVN